MQRTATKLDRTPPLLDFFPPDQEVVQEVRSKSFAYGEKAEGKPTQPEPPYQDLHSFVASMWKVASPAKSKANYVVPKQGQRWQEQQLKIKEEELARKKEELLEARARNKSLERQHRRDERNLDRAARELEELQSSNTSLWEELEDVLSINRVADQQQRDAQLKISKLYREMIELRRINANLRKELGAPRLSQKLIFSYSNEPREGLTTLNDICGPNMVGIVPSQEEVTDQEMDYGSEAASCFGNDNDFGTTGSNVPPLPEIVDLVHFCLAGTVSRWVKGIQAACNPETVEALVLPWLMRKLFGLTSEVVTKRREELGNLFKEERIAKSSDPSADREFDRTAAEPANNQPRDHHLILFPLSADEIQATIDTIMMSLAHRYDGSCPGCDIYWRCKILTNIITHFVCLSCIHQVL